jgi:hypothetical protein
MTAILTPTALVILVWGIGAPNLQKLAAGWLGTVIGYWFR